MGTEDGCYMRWVLLRLLGRVAAAVCPLARLALAAAAAAAAAAADVDKQSDSVVRGTHYRTKLGTEECRVGGPP